MLRFVLGLGLGILIIAQSWAILYLTSLPNQIVRHLNLPVYLQIVIGVTWLILMGWGMMGLMNGKRFRVILVISGFIIYSLLQIVVFSQADYDQQREPFLLMLLGFIVLLMIATKYKENFTND
ncbi:MAG: hypothetical protein Kow00117_03790 [Phototrophicales bacterium]